MSLGEIVSQPSGRSARKSASAKSEAGEAKSASAEAQADSTKAAETPAATTKTTDKPAQQATQQPAADDDIWADPPEGETVPRGVYVATRKKMRERLQQIERENAKFQGELAAMRQMSQDRQAQAPVAPPPKAPTREELEAEFYKDPVGFHEKQQERVRVEVRQQRYAMSEALVRSQHNDADEAIGAFVQAAQSNPGLLQQFQNHQHPAMFAYQFGKQVLSIPEGVASVADLEKHLREKIKAEVENELRGQNAISAAQAIQPSSASVPGSSAAQVAEPTEAGFGFLPTRWA